MSITTHPAYDPAVDPKAAADYLNTHYKTLLRWTHEGHIAAIRTRGGRLSYRLSDLNAYLESRRVAPKSPKATQDIDWGA